MINFFPFLSLGGGNVVAIWSFTDRKTCLVLFSETATICNRLESLVWLVKTKRYSWKQSILIRVVLGNGYRARNLSRLELFSRNIIGYSKLINCKSSTILSAALKTFLRLSAFKFQLPIALFSRPKTSTGCCTKIWRCYLCPVNWICSCYALTV